MAVNKVTLGDETLVDLTSDTVDAAHLLSGYTAHDASGSTISGSYAPPAAMTLPTTTSSSAVGTRRATISPATSRRYLNIPAGYNAAAANYQLDPVLLENPTFTSNGTYDASDWDSHGFGQVTVNVSTPLVVTIGYNSSTQKWEPDCTIQEFQAAYAGGRNIVLVGNGCAPMGWFADDDYVFDYAIYVHGSPTAWFQEYWWTQQDLELIDNVTLVHPDGSISITENGTYPVDFYSEAVVNVSGGGGGATNVVTGSFTGTTTGAAMDVTLSYSGSGYPVACYVWPDGGIVGNTTFNSTVQRYAIGIWSMSKAYGNTTPTYATSGNQNQGATIARYKSSTSSATSYGNAGAHNTNTYSSSNATAAYATALRFKNATTMSVFIASTSYGFMANVKYNYVVVYSS